MKPEYGVLNGQVCRVIPWPGSYEQHRYTLYPINGAEPIIGARQGEFTWLSEPAPQDDFIDLPGDTRLLLRTQPKGHPMPKQLDSLYDLSRYCERHKHVLFVQARINGRLDRYPYADLPPELQGAYLRQWFAEGQIPAPRTRSFGGSPGVAAPS